MLKIAVLLATYNGDKYLKIQLDSILAQKAVQVHVFISDDNSTDSTLQIIEYYCDKYQNIKCINRSRIGGPAKNFYFLINYIDVNKFDFFALSDQDDIWPEHRLLRAVEQIDFYKAHGYSSNVTAVDDKAKYIKIIKKSQAQKRFDYFFETPGPGCTFVLKPLFVNFLQSKLNDNILNFPYHDWLIYALARHFNFKWIIDEDPSFFYRQHYENFMGANFGFKARLKRLNRILFGEYYRELISLYGYLNPKNKNLNFLRVWYFIINFRQTRRKFSHSFLMIPFLVILSIQKNET